MIIYISIFVLVALGAASPFRLENNFRLFVFCITTTFITLIIGMRHEVGGDWLTYAHMLSSIENTPLTVALTTTDPAYAAISWASNQVGGGIYLVNLVCGTIFMAGLMSFCWHQPLPWLALVVATPYPLIVVAMGYTRQSVALGFVFFSLIALQNINVRKFIFFILIGSLFHKSVVVLLPLALAAKNKKGPIKFLLVILVLSITIIYLIYDWLVGTWGLYVEEQMQSDGAMIRVMMNALPALFFLAYRKQWVKRWPENEKIYYFLAFAAIICIPMLQLASTLTDRLALYITPLQIGVYSRLPIIIKGYKDIVIIFAIIIFYLMTLLVWLNFSSYARDSWIPYTFFPALIS